MRTDEEVRVLIVSAYRLLREALRGVLENEGIIVVGDASTARQGLVLARSLSPHVAVLDEQLPDGDAHMLNAQLRASASPTRCIILTSWHRPPTTPPSPGDPILLVRQIAGHGLPAAIRSAARENRPALNSRPHPSAFLEE